MQSLQLRIPTFMIALMLGTIYSAAAQPSSTAPPPGASANASTPPPGDPYVLLMFLQHQTKIFQDIQQQRTADPNGASVTEAGAARLLNLSIADFRVIAPVFQTIKSQLDLIDGQGVAYTQQMHNAKQSLDPAVLQGYTTRIQAVIQSGIANLKQNLSPAGWAALQSYVDGDFRRQITRRPLQ